MSMGLVAKSNAPLFIACRILCISPYALTIMTRRAGFLISLTRARRVSPSISGILISERTISISGLECRTERASSPFLANKKSYSPLRILRRKYCFMSSSRGASSSTLRILTAISLNHLFFSQLIQVILPFVSIDQFPVLPYILIVVSDIFSNLPDYNTFLFRHDKGADEVG